ncbi:UDP-N-acetylglucosamine transporter (Golgi UDP-GlcNAc transporter) (Solute carrier family 35 member A3) [Durusdinium trenchii]|uniref:UDP-N-acetylglucosamine transporter (Golgi UDP-GlcNAc transporter) (Solute carrier family 35 member A3) n=1 Tax=Durusdinium trenchii TaxID=1381693 RepID=A0ABP0SIJ0_9DINO
MEAGGQEAAAVGPMGAAWALLAQPKYLSLLVLVFQNVSLVMMIRHSRTHHGSGSGAKEYVATTAVVTAEVTKIVINLVLEMWSNRTNLAEGFSNLRAELSHPSTLKLALPGLLYMVQNNMLFVALSNLSVPVYQVTSQGKVLATAICSRWLLQKIISVQQYGALVLLALGVAIAQLSSIDYNKHSAKTAGSEAKQNQLLGLGAVLIACFTSGFAGVYFEKILKHGRKVSLYIRNIQLASFGVILGLIPCALHDYDRIAEGGFFQGYDKWVWAVILNQALGGLLVSLVMKYADNILKGFATSVAIIVATKLSSILLGTSVNNMFILGAFFVITSILVFGKYPAKQNSQQPNYTAVPQKEADNLADVELAQTPQPLAKS